MSAITPPRPEQELHAILDRHMDLIDADVCGVDPAAAPRIPGRVWHELTLCTRDETWIVNPSQAVARRLGAGFTQVSRVLELSASGLVPVDERWVGWLTGADVAEWWDDGAVHLSYEKIAGTWAGESHP